MNYIVIGTGVAGIAAVEAIRSVDSFGSIAMIGDDPHGYYSRPGLAYYLTGEVNDRTLYPRTTEEYRSLNFNFAKAPVTHVHRGSRLVELENKIQIPYDKLLIAVGAEAIPLQIPGATFAGVVKLDHMDDAKKILKLAHRRRTGIVVGGGITALELAEGLNARGMKVHYFLRGDRYWSNVLDEDESRIIEQRLAGDGIEIHKHVEVKEVLGKPNRMSGVRLDDGKTMACDLLAYAIGIRPRLGLAKQAELAVDRGILVNESMQTSDPNIFAAGDVAQVYDPFVRKYILDSLWNPAREQGRVAGLNMAGNPAKYARGVPFNVTRLAGLTTTIIGSVGHGRDLDLAGIARGDSETWRQPVQANMVESHSDVNRLRLMVGKTHLLGAVVMGDQRLSRPLERLISEQADISSIQHKLLAKGAKVGEVITEFYETLNSRN